MEKSSNNATRKEELEVETTISSKQGYAQVYGADTLSISNANHEVVVDIYGLFKSKIIYVLDPTIVVKRRRD